MKIIVLLFTLLSVSNLYSTEPTEKQESNFQKLVKDHLKIGYFSELLGPALTNEEGTYPDVDSKGNYVQGKEPIQLWNQVSFGWKLDSTWRAIFNPRFTTQFGDRSRLMQNDGILRTEDFLVGAQGTIWKSGQWSLWVRPAYRLPTSRATIDANWNGQAEWLHILDRAPGTDTKWGMGMWTMYRHYVPSSESTNERWRLYVAPYLTYTINDKIRLEGYYENEIQHNQEIGYKDLNYSQRTLQSAFTGFTYTFSPKFSVFPFIRMYSVRKFDTDTMGVGAWFIATLF
jgi:hypothetical protein